MIGKFFLGWNDLDVTIDDLSFNFLYIMRYHARTRIDERTKFLLPIILHLGQIQ